MLPRLFEIFLYNLLASSNACDSNSILATMKLAIFAAVFAAGFAAAVDTQTVTIGANGPPDGNPACSSL